MSLLWHGLPILLGAAAGYIFSLPVNLALTAIAVIVAGYLLWSTKDAEIGALIGIIAAMVAILFLGSMWITIGIIHGLSLDLSWLLRSAQP